ncbi:MAG: hypothetical protein RR472_07965, partial [Anaerovoracaceae bacterium]
KCKKEFVSAYVTDTRLMGAMGLHIHWEVLDSADAEHLHQFFYFDTEEYGFENYKSIWNNNLNEIKLVEHSLISCLGGNKVNITLREACALLQNYVAFNQDHKIPLPAGLPEYEFLFSPEIRLSEEEADTLFQKECPLIVHEYQLINYFLLRCFGKDFGVAHRLTGKDLPLDLYPEFPIATLCKNTIDEAQGHFLCESLIETNNQYSILLSKIKVEEMKIVRYEKLSGFRVTPAEAAMMLSRPEFITVYEILADPEEIEEENLEFDFNTMVTLHDNGKLFLAFNDNNDHVNKRVFRLSEDVFGLYYITDYGQFILASYSMHGIRALEKDLMKSSIGNYLIPTSKYEFKEPVLYEFIQSDFDDFEDFLDAIRDDDE